MRQDAHLCRFEVNEDVVIVRDGMRVRGRFFASSLEVFSAYQTAVDVEI